MTCRDMDGVINSRSRDSALPPEASEHIGRCERCREVMRVLMEGPEIRQPSESGVRLIHGSLLRDLRPVRPLAPSSVFLAGFAISFLAVAVVGSIQLHAYGWNVLSVSAKIVVFASLVLGAAALALSMARQMRPGSKYSVSPNLLPAGVLLLVAVAMMAVFHSREEKAFFSSGLRCLSSGLKYAIPGPVLAWLWLRRGACAISETDGSDRRRVRRTHWRYGAGSPLSQLEPLPHPGLALGRDLTQRVGRSGARRGGGGSWKVASLSIRVQLQITALIGERFLFPGEPRPSDEDVTDRAGFCRSFQ